MTSHIMQKRGSTQWFKASNLLSGLKLTERQIQSFRYKTVKQN
jgi:hypothetical protein